MVCQAYTRSLTKGKTRSDTFKKQSVKTTEVLQRKCLLRDQKFLTELKRDWRFIFLREQENHTLIEQNKNRTTRNFTIHIAKSNDTFWSFTPLEWEDEKLMMVVIDLESFLSISVITEENVELTNFSPEFYDDETTNKIRVYLNVTKTEKDEGQEMEI